MVAGPASRERPTERRRDSTERRHTKTPQAEACEVLAAPERGRMRQLHMAAADLGKSKPEFPNYQT